MIGAREVLVLPVGDVLLGLRVPVLLRQAEIDDVHLAQHVMWGGTNDFRKMKDRKQCKTRRKYASNK